ncbi:MAG: hypothetical protein V1821_02430 [bacterium]
MADIAQLQQAYIALREKKEAKKEILQAFSDELEHDSHYQEVLEQIKTLREEKKRIEAECYARAMADVQRLEELKLDCKSHEELISDLALTLYLQNQSVEVTDEYNNKYAPLFVVRFKKSGEVEEKRPKAPSVGDEISAQEPAETGPAVEVEVQS